MFNLKKVFVWAVSVILTSTFAYAGNTGHISASQNTSPHIIELRPIPESYKIAGLTFLPELEDSEFGWNGREFSGNHNQGNNCSGYELTSCPSHGSCSSCPFDRKYKKLISCTGGYTKSGNSCSASSCSAVGYDTNIPANKICTKVTEGGMNCYKDCKSVSCSGYTLNCDSFNVENSSGKATCPDCESANANCSPKLCKVSSCMDGFKIADNGTSCVALDDTCPNGYFKECDTGIIQNKTTYTEAGSSCYQCKAATQENNCPILTPAQKCAEEGYKTMNEWNSEKPSGDLILGPAETTTSPELSLTSAEFTKTKSSTLNDWFKEILGIKTASATSMMTICDDCRLTGCKSSICASSCPEACSATVKPMLTYEFDKTAVCPYDSSYVKGVWTQVSTETELPTPMECSSDQKRLICSGVTWCCNSLQASCSTLNSSSTNRCYSRACMTQECEGYNDNIAKTGKGWTSESCMPVAANCIKGPVKYKNTCQTSILYNLSSCPVNARCESDCSNKFKVVGCDCGYTLQNGTCVADGGTTPAEPAFALPVLYSDLTTSKNLVAGKTPIGVVYNESKKLAVALTDSKKAWSTTTFDISGLTNYDDYNLSSATNKAINDTNGKNNTKIIVNYCQSNGKSCPAAEYAASYSTEGASAGNWYLPATAEATPIFDYSTRSNLNSTLRALSSFGATELVYGINGQYWHSTESTSTQAWMTSNGGGSAGVGMDTKTKVFNVRPIINYGDVKQTCNAANCETCVSGSSVRCQTCKSGYKVASGVCCTNDYKYDCDENSGMYGKGTVCGGLYKSCGCTDDNEEWDYGYCKEKIRAVLEDMSTYCNYPDGCGGHAICVCNGAYSGEISRKYIDTWLGGDSVSVDQWSVESELEYTCDAECS